MRNRLLLLLALPACVAHAANIDLSSRIGQGKWSLAYQRTGELIPLHFKHKEAGVSYTCIEGDPRVKIVDWIQSKGCTLHNEKMDGDVYRMTGECTLKWWRGTPIPVTVALHPETRSSFTIDIQTLGNSVLGYTEHTQGSLTGPCDPKPAMSHVDSALQGKQDKSGQPDGQTEKQ